jgi:hypothetical protein
MIIDILTVQCPPALTVYEHRYKKLFSATVIYSPNAYNQNLKKSPGPKISVLSPFFLTSVRDQRDFFKSATSPETYSWKKLSEISRDTDPLKSSSSKIYYRRQSPYNRTITLYHLLH